eukprot:1157507-Pelagomonas_calceolata.AAC.6
MHMHTLAVSRRKSASSRRSEGLLAHKSVDGGSMEDMDGPDSPSGRTQASELYRCVPMRPCMQEQGRI